MTFFATEHTELTERSVGGSAAWSIANLAVIGQSRDEV
jgi:hypothetical protein